VNRTLQLPQLLKLPKTRHTPGPEELCACLPPTLAALGLPAGTRDRGFRMAAETPLAIGAHDATALASMGDCIVYRSRGTLGTASPGRQSSPAAVAQAALGGITAGCGPPSARQLSRLPGLLARASVQGVQRPVETLASDVQPVPDRSSGGSRPRRLPSTSEAPTAFTRIAQAREQFVLARKPNSPYASPPCRHADSSAPKTPQTGPSLAKAIAKHSGWWEKMIHDSEARDRSIGRELARANPPSLAQVTRREINSRSSVSRAGYSPVSGLDAPFPFPAAAAGPAMAFSSASSSIGSDQEQPRMHESPAMRLGSVEWTLPRSILDFPDSTQGRALANAGVFLDSEQGSPALPSPRSAGGTGTLASRASRTVGMVRPRASSSPRGLAAPDDASICGVSRNDLASSPVSGVLDTVAMFPALATEHGRSMLERGEVTLT
jgi:hypothetical protein